ncbi:beta-ketoacyl-[acyl-carrier-protein] synthase family protein [Micromonospora maritima]|uniref:Beta-ketoacyl-[acyl-carrier-protein] synthase family protein n=1 Tax=Micromonospora maritima TaxID=986711 RepID=A0ABW7ZJ08_9ACTN
MAGHAVAVTGLGLVTPAGIGVTRSWERVVAGDPTAEHDDALAGNPVDISCRVPDFAPSALLGGPTARRLDRFVQFALVAVREALADAGLDHRTWDGARVGVVLGCADGGPGTVEAEHRVLLADSPGAVSPLLLPKQLPNMLAGWVCIDIGATGPSLVVATACASGGTAVGLARDLLLADRCDVVVAGGSEAMVTPLVMAGFAQMGALSRRLDDPKTACRPFDVDRDGFVAGEGAGILVLERPADAAARGARVRAMVRGFGATADAHHMTQPDPAGRGVEAAMRAALRDADLGGADVDHVNAHGTGTPQGDLVEAAALRRVLGRRPLLTSTKGVTGHMFGAAGAVEAAFSVLAVQRDVVPPTAGLATLDPRVELAVPTTSTPARLDVALSTSMGFGGQNAALVVTAV